MAFEQRDIPRLSDNLFNVADAVARKTLGRRFFRMSDIGMTEDGEIRWTAPTNGNSLPGLAILAALRDMETYRSPNNYLTRRNTVVVARVGGAALRHITDLASGRGVTLSPQAVDGIKRSASIIHNRLEETFMPLARELPDDREALFFLTRAGRILGKNGRP